MASCGIVVRPSGSKTGLTSTSVQEIGTYKNQYTKYTQYLYTFAALKTVFTELEISGPIPSPGIIDT